jgi:hypothetical protein
VNNIPLPEKFYRWAYLQRAEVIRKLAAGEEMSHERLFLGFTRHNPVLISHGPAGLNGSVKGFGFYPRRELMPEILEAFLEHIDRGPREGYSEEGLALLTKYIWGEGCADNLDFTVLSSLEMAKKHSWENLRTNPEATLVYYQPPAISFEVRGWVEFAFPGDIYHTYVNALHDVYHTPRKDLWDSRPAYVFHIEEIFDNSTGRDAFGTKIWG